MSRINSINHLCFWISKALFYAGLCCFAPMVLAKPIPVELKALENGWQLLRGGAPYFIRGAGGNTRLAELKAAGANSIRTWGGDAEETLALLDKAHQLGLSVTVGLWLGHERHGFDYANTAQVAKQRQQIHDTVLKLKNHPAVLLWGIGNEMEGFAEGDNPLIWQEVNYLAAMVKRLDPLHPTMTVTAYVHGERIPFVHQRSPAIDIHGINAYGGGVKSMLEKLQTAKASKPIVLTEFGPVGPWERPKTAWGAPLERTSTDKAATYKNSYHYGVTAAGKMSLGSYVFLWGHKMESTETWFGLFLADGAMLGAVDVMTQIWSGQQASNLAPRVQALSTQAGTTLAPGAKLSVSTAVEDPEQGELRSVWALKNESADIITGGDYRATPLAIPNVILSSKLSSAQLRMPQKPGAYRLFYTVYDDAGKAATANLPLYVPGKAGTQLPLQVYQERLEHMPWVPSGWMGNVNNLSLDGRNTEQVYQGEAAIKIRYVGRSAWAGIAWQNPANNGGDKAGGYSLDGATSLSLWARGAYGGEEVSFGVGLNDETTAYPDSAISKRKTVVLTDQWQRYTVPLSKHDLSSIKTGFVVVLKGRASPVTVYLDNIQFND